MENGKAIEKVNENTGWSGTVRTGVAGFHTWFGTRSAHVVTGALLYPLWVVGLSRTVPVLAWYLHPLAVLIAVVTWDLSSGFIHWTFDELSQDNPVLGHLAKTFQLHHTKPQLFLEWSVWENCKYDHLAALPLMGGALLLPISPLALEAAVFYTIFGGFSEWFHAFGHGAHRKNPIVRKLSAVGILLSTKHHGQHHAWPHKKNYCIFNGMCDPILNRFATLLRYVRGTAPGA